MILSALARLGNVSNSQFVPQLSTVAAHEYAPASLLLLVLQALGSAMNQMPCSAGAATAAAGPPEAAGVNPLMQTPAPASTGGAVSPANQVPARPTAGGNEALEAT